MNPANRQDVQNIVEGARNRIMERMVTRQDILILNDTIKNLSALNLQTQQLLKQADYNRSQSSRRIVALEARIASLQNEVRVLASLVARTADQKPQQVIMPVANATDDESLQKAVQQARYIFRPN